MYSIRFIAVLVLAGCLVALSACNKDSGEAREAASDKPEGAAASGQAGEKAGQEGATATSDDGGITTVVGAEAGMPENWPDGLPQYPGSQVASSHVQTDVESKAMAVSLLTTDSEEQVLEFYEEKALAAGFRHFSTTEYEGSKVNHYVTDELVFNIDCEPTENGIGIMLMVAPHYLGQPGDDKPENGQETADEEAGSQDGTPSDTSEDDMATMTVGELPEGFPDNVLKPYPGASIEQVIMQGGEILLMQSTTDSVEKASEFYEKHFTGRGWVKTDDYDMAGTRMMAFTSSAGEITFSATDADGNTMISLIFIPGDEAASAEEKPESADGETNGDDSVAYAEGKLPSGFPTDILPLYPGSEISSAAISGDDYTMIQLSTDPEHEVIKYYDKFFREHDWKKETSMKMEGRYVAGWTKDIGTIGMTVHTEDDGQAFVSLVYTKN